MAITMQDTKPLGVVKLIAKRDSAIKVTPEEYEEYLKAGCDEELLKFVEGQSPTRFVVDLGLDAKAYKAIKNSMAGGAGENTKVTLGDWHAEVVKRILKGIEYEASVPQEKQLVFKTDSKGLVDDGLMARLERVGVNGNIFALYSIMVLDDEARAEVKNS